MPASIWTTKNARTWLFQKDEYPDRLFLSCCGVSSIELTSQMGAEWRCPMCGSLNRHTLKCDGCNAPRRAMATRGIAAVEGFLPMALVLDRLVGSFGLEVHCSICGDPAQYVPENVIVRLRDCQVLRKWIPELNPVGSTDYVPIMLCLEVGCAVELAGST